MSLSAWQQNCRKSFYDEEFSRWEHNAVGTDARGTECLVQNIHWVDISILNERGSTCECFSEARSFSVESISWHATIYSFVMIVSIMTIVCFPIGCILTCVGDKFTCGDLPVPIMIQQWILMFWYIVLVLF